MCAHFLQQLEALGCTMSEYADLRQNPPNLDGHTGSKELTGKSCVSFEAIVERHDDARYHLETGWRCPQLVHPRLKLILSF